MRIARSLLIALAELVTSKVAMPRPAEEVGASFSTPLPPLAPEADACFSPRGTPSWAATARAKAAS